MTKNESNSMMRLSIKLSLFIFVTANTVWSQQDKLITHFMYDKMSVNPGETGIDEGVCGTSIYRNQWDKVVGAPNSFVLNAEANMNQYFPGGIGVNFYHDAIGFARQNTAVLNYAYPVFTDFGTLGVGIGVGLYNFGLQPEWVPPTNVPDPKLPVGYSVSGLDLNFGAYFKGVKDFYVGFSSTHLTAPRLGKEVTNNGAPALQEYNVARHYYLMGGYTTQPIGPGRIDGNLLFRSDFVKTSADLNLRYLLKTGDLEYYGGLSFRTRESIPIMIGGSMNNFTVGYSYDITISKIANVSQGSHELMVRYCYYLSPPVKTPSKHPRWL
jgi:type IX secretion system PorP/SprF family membrane protein